MPLTYSFSTDASPGNERVVAQGYCTKIIIYENNQAGTADYLIRAPLVGSPQITRPAGSQTEFTSPRGEQFYAGQTVAFISSASGTLTFVQEEY